MPFLLMTGHPSSGKTTIVNRLVDHFSGKNKDVVVVKDEDYSIFSRSIYTDSQKEKDHRSFIRSQVQKHISKSTIVICDALNYIKGYRYELFLIGKLAKTTFAVLHCSADGSTCEWLNSQKEEALQYEGKTINELIMRYEKPESRNRWDSPLFEIKIGKAERALEGEIPDDMSVDLEYPSPRFVTIPFNDIYNWLCEGTALTENQSTQVVPLAPTNYLHELDRTTQEVVAAVVQGQREGIMGQQIIITSAEEGSNQVQFTKVRSLPELTRLRRQFISFSKSHPIANSSKIATLFVNFLNTTNVK